MNNIGYMLRVGDGVEENKEEALEWYLKAAKAGDMDAQYHLGDAWRLSGHMEEIALILIALILIRIVVRYHYYDYDR